MFNSFAFIGRKQTLRQAKYEYRRSILQYSILEIKKMWVKGLNKMVGFPLLNKWCFYTIFIH